MNKQSVTDRVLQQLQHDILSGRFMPGDKLNIEQIKLDYAVSLTPVREALNRLVSQGYVEFIPNRGFRVMSADLDEVKDLYQTWLFILQHALALAIEHGDDDWEAEILATSHRLTKYTVSDQLCIEQDYFTWAERYQEFITALISACPSTWHIRLNNLLFEQAQRYRFLKLQLLDDTIGHIQHNAKANSELAQLVIARDETKARTLLEQQFAALFRELERVWEF